MAKFLIKYSSAYDAKRTGCPPAGTVVEINTIEDLDQLILQMQSPVIIWATGSEAWWAWHHDTMDDEEKADQHCVSQLPEGWQEMRWIEIYNSLRE